MTFEEDLKRKHIELNYPYYQGWAYDQPYEDDPFLTSLRHGITDRMVTVMNGVGYARIFPCSRMSATRHAHSGAMSMIYDIDASIGECDAQRGEIFIPREYKKNGEYEVSSKPSFIAAHELMHVIDSELGDWKADQWGEGYLMPTSKAHRYVGYAYQADQRAKPQATQLTEKFDLYREGLVTTDPKAGRDNGAEICCDLGAHILTGQEPEMFERLARSHPNLLVITQIMIKATEVPNGVKIYKKMANLNRSFGEISHALDSADTVDWTP